MSQLFIFLSFIPWALCYLKYTLNLMGEMNHKIITLTWFKKSIFNIFRFESLILIAIYLYFIRYENELVTVMLFAVICLYLFAASFHDDRNKKKGKIYRSNFITLAITILATLVPFIYYYNTDNLSNTYIILFMYLFFSRFIVLIANCIYNIIPKYKGPRKR